VQESHLGPGGSSARVRGLARVGRPLGTVGAVVLALIWAQAKVPAMTDRYIAEHTPHLPADFAWEPLPSQGEVSMGTSQPHAFTLVCIAVVVATGVYAAVDALLSRWRATRTLAWGLRVATAITAVVVAWRASHFAGQAALAVLIPGAIVCAAYAGGGGPAPPPRSRAPLVVGLVAEAVALGWGVWLTSFELLGSLTFAVTLALAAAACVRAGALLTAREDAERTLERDLAIGAPLLFTPLIGLHRAPSAGWLVAVLAVCGVLALALRSRLAERLTPFAERVGRVVAAVGGPWAIGAIFVVPMRFRDLGDIDHFDHEGQHLGWLNSASHGHWFMADASFIYGPLRESLLVAIAWLFGGLTAEHVREAHVVLNLAGLAFLLYAGWRICRGRAWPMAWWTVLVLVQTPLSFLIRYRDSLSFGWVDVARTGIASVALVGGLDAIARARCDGPFRTLLRDQRAVVGWGVLCGVATLYSQDYGPCVFGSLGLAMIGDAVFRRHQPGLVQRARRAIQLALAWTAGTFSVLVAFVLFYAVFGKAGVLIRRLTSWTGAVLSGSWGAQGWAFAAKDYFDPAHYVIHDGPTLIAEGLVAPCAILIGATVVVTMAVSGRWSWRTTRLLAFLAFAFTTFRHAVVRVDIFHLRSDGTPGLLLLFALGCDVAGVRLRVGARAGGRGALLPIGAALVGVGALFVPFFLGTVYALQYRLQRVASGEETPGPEKPYDNHTVPRAGDVQVAGNVKALAEWVRANTSPSDAVWSTPHFIRGGELAFLIDRRNPTPFDVAHELTTHADQAEVLGDLQRDPPAIIVGDYFNLVGDAVRKYVAAHWKSVAVPGWGNVRRYDPSSVTARP
jgi:hypothetical protein